MRWRRLLFRITALAVALPCIYLYERYIEKPRILTTAPEPALVSGWVQWRNPSGVDSIGVPPRFIICDAMSAGFQAKVAELKKTDPEDASEIEKLASQDPPREGFVAIRPPEAKSKTLSLASCKFWVEHAEKIIPNDDDSMKKIGETIAAQMPTIKYGPMQKIKTPATTAYLWTGTGTGEAPGFGESDTQIVFLDKWDLFTVELYELPAETDALETALQIAQTFREYHAHDPWRADRR
jgi:hypothetical protein